VRTITMSTPTTRRDILNIMASAETVAAASPLSIPLAASPYIAHDLMETDSARTGKDQGRATRDAGSGRPQYPARNRDQASA